MIYLALGIIMIFVSFKFNKSKIVTVCWAILMFSMMAFTGDSVPDREIYLIRFSGVNDDNSIIELLFSGAVALYRNIGLNWFALQITIALGFSCMMYFMATKFSKNPNYTFILYYFTGLFIDIVQVRNTMGLIFLIPGILFLTKKGWKWDLASAGLIVLAGLCHGIFFIYLLMILAKNIKVKWLALGLLGVSALVYGVYLLNLDTKLISLLGDIYPRLEEHYLAKSLNKYNFGWFTFKSLFLFVSIEGLLYFVYNHTEENNKPFIQLMMKIAIVSAIGIPLIIYTADFYRIQRNLLFVYAIALTYIKLPKKDNYDIAMYRWNLSIYNLGVILFVVSFIFLYYVKSLDFNNVVIPVFKDIIFF
ncbi:MAG: EpsG family protein [Acholeplasmatales bacterium]|nr:EpsG family protein [Acholeplasmatales bacterium]